jgi:hypothetical protein
MWNGGLMSSGKLRTVAVLLLTLATIRVGRRHRPGRPRQKPERAIGDGGWSLAIPLSSFPGKVL